MGTTTFVLQPSLLSGPAFKLRGLLLAAFDAFEGDGNAGFERFPG